MQAIMAPCTSTEDLAASMGRQSFGYNENNDFENLNCEFSK